MDSQGFAVLPNTIARGVSTLSLATTVWLLRHESGDQEAPLLANLLSFEWSSTLIGSSFSISSRGTFSTQSRKCQRASLTIWLGVSRRSPRCRLLASITLNKMRSPPPRERDTGFASCGSRFILPATQSSLDRAHSSNNTQLLE